MARSYDEYHRILELWDSGLKNKKAISRLTGIPRATVRDCINRYGSLVSLSEAAHQQPQAILLNTIKNSLDEEHSALCANYAYLLGLYLGDGSIAKVRNVYRLRVKLDARYPNIIDRCRKALQALLPENEVGIVEHFYNGRLSCVDVSCYYKFWDDLFPQHGIGKKHTRPIRLEDWQERIVTTYPLEFFRGLFHSDGSRFSNVVNGKDYPRYQFTNFSTDIITLFCKTCDLLDLHWTSKAHRAGKPVDVYEIYISRRKDVEYLDSVIGPKN